MKIHAVLFGLVSSAAIAQTCTFTAFGRPCGGALAGTQVGTPAQGVRLDVTGAQPGTIAVLGLGHQARPSPLPGTTCELLIDPRVLHFAQVDRLGQVVFRFQLPPTLPLSVDLQVVTVGVTRNGRTAESTNGLNILVQ